MAWIMSQNGAILLDASMLWVNDYGQLSACIGSDWDKGRNMGNFPTEEQAMAELNKIITWIKESIPGGVYQITRPLPDKPKGETAP
jgi:hypothetical protein